jgi:glutathione peroxidase
MLGLLARRALLAAALCLAAGAAAAQSPTGGGSMSGFDFAFTSIDGEKLPLAQYRGRPMLVVNTASFCGFTYQYEDLETLWRRYRDRGLVLIGVPSNDFGQQEPGSSKDIKEFCHSRYAVDFPLTEKQEVTGPAAHPFSLDRRGARRCRRAALELPQVPRRPRWRPRGRLAVLGPSDRLRCNVGDRPAARGKTGKLTPRCDTDLLHAALPRTGLPRSRPRSGGFPPSRRGCGAGLYTGGLHRFHLRGRRHSLDFGRERGVR